MRLTRALWTTQKVVTSPYKLGNVPATPLAHHILDSLAIWDGEGTAIIDGTSGASVTRNQLADQILRVSTAVQARVRPGDVVAVSLPNIPQYMLPVIGSIHAGAKVGLMNPIYTEEETRHALNLTKPRCIVTTALSLPAILSQMPSTVEEVVVLGPIPDSVSGKVTPFTSLLKETPAPISGVVPDSLLNTALMPFSSGTTGLPKAVCLSHRNVVSHLIQMRHPQFGTVEAGMNLLCLLPMFHMYGWAISVTSLNKGATITSLPRFQPDVLLEAIQKYAINHLPIVPPIATFLARHPMVDNYDLSSVISIQCAAAPLSPAIQEQLATRLKVNMIRNGYGMSEMVAGGLIPHPERASELMKKGGVGQVLAGMEARIVDIENGADLGPGQEGEILLRGPNVMDGGYLGDPGATASTVDSDGWIYTGDIGKYDDEGDFCITDRLKELIKVKGFQVAPAELESIILGLPGVADVCVIGVPAAIEGDGEVPKAFVVKKAGEDVTEENILEGVADKLASYKQVKGGVVFVDSLPRSPAGKLLRKELRKL